MIIMAWLATSRTVWVGEEPKSMAGIRVRSVTDHELWAGAGTPSGRLKAIARDPHSLWARSNGARFTRRTGGFGAQFGAPPGPDVTGVGGGGGWDPAGSAGVASLAGPGGSSGGGADSWNGEGLDVTGGRGLCAEGATSDDDGGAFFAWAFSRSSAFVAALRTSSFLS